jgi:CDP-diacylglycerol--serine O-phosphatidyltransferase
MSIKKNIPNALTLGNLLCGCLAIVKIFQGDLVWAAYLVGIAGALDFFDGFAARLLKVSSPIGKDLDSLADMVTFGVVPGIIMFKLIFFSQLIAKEGWTIYPPLSALSDKTPSIWSFFPTWLPYCAFIIPIFSAIRLAKFNNDTRQSESFIGLPTPANAILICSIPLIPCIRYQDFGSTIGSNHLLIRDFIINPFTLLTASCLLSLLLVAPLPLFALKFKNFKWKGNEIRFIFLIWSILLLVLLQFIGIPLIIFSYVLFSVVNNFQKRRKSDPDSNH